MRKLLSTILAILIMAIVGIVHAQETPPPPHWEVQISFQGSYESMTITVMTTVDAYCSAPINGYTGGLTTMTFNPSFFGFGPGSVVTIDCSHQGQSKSGTFQVPNVVASPTPEPSGNGGNNSGDQATAVLTPTDAGVCVQTSARLNVRSTPEIVRGNVVGRLGRNVQVTIQNPDGDAWGEIVRGQYAGRYIYLPNTRSC